MTFVRAKSDRRSERRPHRLRNREVLPRMILTQGVTRNPGNDDTPDGSGARRYRYWDSNRERRWGWLGINDPPRVAGVGAGAVDVEQGDRSLPQLASDDLAAADGEIGPAGVDLAGVVAPGSVAHLGEQAHRGPPLAMRAMNIRCTYDGSDSFWGIRRCGPRPREPPANRWFSWRSLPVVAAAKTPLSGLARVICGADELTFGVDICPSLLAANRGRIQAALDELRADTVSTEQIQTNGGTAEQQSVLEFDTVAGPVKIVATPAGVPRGYWGVAFRRHDRASRRRSAALGRVHGRPDHDGRGTRPLARRRPGSRAAADTSARGQPARIVETPSLRYELPAPTPEPPEREP